MISNFKNCKWVFPKVYQLDTTSGWTFWAKWPKAACKKGKEIFWVGGILSHFTSMKNLFFVFCITYSTFNMSVTIQVSFTYINFFMAF